MYNHGGGVGRRGRCSSIGKSTCLLNGAMWVRIPPAASLRAVLNNMVVTASRLTVSDARLWIGKSGMIPPLA